LAPTLLASKLLASKLLASKLLAAKHLAQALGLGLALGHGEKMRISGDGAEQEDQNIDLHGRLSPDSHPDNFDCRGYVP